MSKGNDLIESGALARIQDKLRDGGFANSMAVNASDLRRLFDAIADRDATIARLSEALAEAEKKGAEDWQPIETAPRDGTRIILLRKNGPVFGCWDDDRYSTKPRPYWTHDQVRAFGNVDARKVPPTHWMPLPAPPRDLSQGGQHG